MFNKKLLIKLKTNIMHFDTSFLKSSSQLKQDLIIYQMTQNYNHWLVCYIIVWFPLSTRAVVVVSACGWHGFRVRLLCRPRAVALAPVRGCFGLSSVALDTALGSSAFARSFFDLFEWLYRRPHALVYVCVQFATASACGCFGVRARLLWFLWVVVLASARGCFGVCARFASESACSCFGVRARLVRLRVRSRCGRRGGPRKDASAAARSCSGFHARTLGRPHMVTVASTSNVYKAWHIVFEDIMPNLNEFELLIKPRIFNTDKYMFNYWG